MNFFHVALLKPQRVKSLRQKQKTMAHIGNSPGWKNWTYFEQRIQVTSPFLCQVNFSILLFEVCFQLLSVTSKIIPFQFVHFEPVVPMQNYSRLFEGFLLTSRDTIQTLYHSICWQYIFTSATLTQLFFSCIV